MQVGVRLGAEHHRKIQDAGQKIGAHLIGIVRLDVEGGLGQGAAELGHPVAQIDRRKVVLDAKAEKLRRPLRDLDAALGFVPFVAQRAGVRLEPLALGCQVGARAGAVEEAASDRLFQRRDPGRDGGLGDPEAVRRAVEAAGFREVEEGVEEVDLHHCALG